MRRDTIDPPLVSQKLHLVREAKIEALLDADEDRYEASGIVLPDAETALVVFDNLACVARLDLSLQPADRNALLPVLASAKGFEAIARDGESGRFFLVVEAVLDADGKRRGLLWEYDADLRYLACTRLETTFVNDNKGFEGLFHRRDDSVEELWALCEGNNCTAAKQGRGRIEVYRPGATIRWERSHGIVLPAGAEFEDYSGLALRGDRIAVVSQRSERLWVGRVDASGCGFVDEGTVYEFPERSFENVEGVAWRSDQELVAVSDRYKGDGDGGRHDQSIHVFELPAPA